MEFPNFWWVYFLGSVGGGFVSLSLFYVVLCWLGFTLYGVRALSFASRVHSHYGDVEEGSCFACLQSTGACGKPCWFNMILFLIGAGVSYYLISLYFNQDNSVPDIVNSTMTTLNYNLTMLNSTFDYTLEMS